MKAIQYGGGDKKVLVSTNHEEDYHPERSKEQRLEIYTCIKLWFLYLPMRKIQSVGVTITDISTKIQKETIPISSSVVPKRSKICKS